MNHHFRLNYINIKSMLTLLIAFILGAVGINTLGIDKTYADNNSAMKYADKVLLKDIIYGKKILKNKPFGTRIPVQTQDNRILYLERTNADASGYAVVDDFPYDNPDNVGCGRDVGRTIDGILAALISAAIARTAYWIAKYGGKLKGIISRLVLVGFYEAAGGKSAFRKIKFRNDIVRWVIGKVC